MNLGVGDQLRHRQHDRDSGSAPAARRNRNHMAVPAAVRPLNDFLRRLHGPTACLGATMSTLVPFPASIGSLPDADILDLNVELCTPYRGGRPRARVEASARYATEASVDQASEFYRHEFTTAGVGAFVPVILGDRPKVVLETWLPEQDGTSYSVSIDDYGSYRSVRVTVGYEWFDHAATFARFACWHDGAAPVGAAEPTGIEISTFGSGLRPSTILLYTTRFACERKSSEAMRQIVDDELKRSCWSYTELVDGILFIQGAPFEAETHLFGDKSACTVSFVGEFQLRG